MQRIERFSQVERIWFFFEGLVTWVRTSVFFPGGVYPHAFIEILVCIYCLSNKYSDGALVIFICGLDVSPLQLTLHFLQLSLCLHKYGNAVRNSVLKILHDLHIQIGTGQ